MREPHSRGGVSQGPGAADHDLGWGFIGTGNISATAAREARESGSARLVSVWGRDAQRAYSFAQEHGFEDVCENLADLFANDAVEAVYVALPHALHVDVVLEALDAGKHVLCEKPLGLNAEEVQRVVDHPASNSCWVAEGFMVRHHPQWRWIESVIADGVIGHVRMIQAHSCMGALVGVPTSQQLAGQGSILLDIGCYSVHLIRTLFGAEPRHVSSFANDGEPDTSVVVQLRFAHGWAQFFVSQGAAPARRMHIIGEMGSIEVFSPIRPPRDAGATVIVHSQHAGQSSELQFPENGQFGLQFADFRRAVRGRTPPLVDLQNALANARCMDAIRRSFEQCGQVVACS